MIPVQEILCWLDEVAPLQLAAEWDNVGLLLGDPTQQVSRVMTCLTLSEDVADEAVESSAGLVITHHPIPFRPVSKISTLEPTGKILWKLANAGICVYCPHTAWDSALKGINHQWAELLGLENVRPLAEAQPDGTGVGRLGELSVPVTLGNFVESVKAFLRLDRVGVAGERSRVIRRVGIACGAGGELIPAAITAQCDTLVTGELSYHRVLEAKARGLTVVMVGHYASERFAMEYLARLLADAFPSLTVWASNKEGDPICWV
jgi:dinuclear metal center YbgI/SA1388 family protein